MKLFTACLIALFMFISFSCVKDHVVNPEPENPSDISKLQTEVVGKWIVETNSGRTTGDEAFLEFLSDSTYIIYNVTEKIELGKYEAVSDKNIELEGFGTLTNVSFKQGKIIFSMTYGGRTVNITAGKSAEISTEDRTKLLARNWSITEDEDGAALLTSDDDPNLKFEMNFIFSAAGTSLIVYKFQGAIWPDRTGSWKWHPSIPGRVIWWNDGEGADEGDYFDIRELTSGVLKITTKADNDIDVNLTLRPSK